VVEDGEVSKPFEVTKSPRQEANTFDSDVDSKEKQNERHDLVNPEKW
jgi:hypothetical protein